MAKREYLDEAFKRYMVAASRAQKSAILNEICATCHCHRKHAIRALSKRKRLKNLKATNKRGRKATYDPQELLKPLKKIWVEENYPCSKRLKASLPIWLPGYESLFEILSVEVRSE